MDVLPDLTGFFGIVVGLLWSFVCLFRSCLVKVPAIVLAIAVLLFYVGLAISPATDEWAVNDEAVGPELGIILCEEDNPYGHPHDETLRRLAEPGSDIYHTDFQGAIVITTDGQTYEVNLEPWD